MKIKKYIVEISVLSVVLLSTGAIIYKSLADETNLSQEVNEGENKVDEEPVQESEIKEELKDEEGSEKEEVEGVEADDEHEQSSNEVEQTTNDTATGPVELKKESVVSYSVTADKSLPKLVGKDVSKSNSLKDELPLLPGFRLSGDMYICNVNNLYDTVIRMYKVTEKDEKDVLVDKVIVMTGSEVIYDKQIQDIVSVVLNYYENKKWEFIYNGDHSYFDIRL